MEKVASKAYENSFPPLLKELFEGQNKKAFLREHAIAASRKSCVCPLNKEAIPKEKIFQGREMDEPVVESSIGNSYETTRRRATIEAFIKKVLEPEPSQSTIQALCNATRKRSEAERRNFSRTRSSEEIKIWNDDKRKEKGYEECQTCNWSKGKETPSGKGPMLEMQSKLW